MKNLRFRFSAKLQACDLLTIFLDESKSLQRQNLDAQKKGQKSFM